MVHRLIVALAAALLLTSVTEASVSVSGALTAKEACPAYVSIQKQTNPGHVTLEKGNSYAIFELNKPGQADWAHVRIPGDVNPAERWVRLRCGDVTLTSGGGPQEGGGGPGSGTPTAGRTCKVTQCNQADQEDSMVLALSWQPAFCESSAGRKKNECKQENPHAYAATHFTLHGLWPNKNSCGTNYGYCGTVCSPPKNDGPQWMCHYPEAPWNGPVPEDVLDVMPSIQAGSCLDRHEWYKHGACAAPWTTPEYFSFAATLVKEFNDAGMAQIMVDNLGRDVKEQKFRDAIDRAFGPGASQRLSLECSNQMLTGVSIPLPGNLQRTETLKEMLQQGQRRGHSNCAGHFRVDRAGH